ncbi:hypothetical protein G6F56_001173 [Rhizopus delemar]|nr:hypothetical protein G6F56_001173 [Rhizopus delemar]
METFVGCIKTPLDALVIFEACNKGQLHKVNRRLTSKERSEIRSGSVFAWDEEAGMRRWTDGRTWSPSRVLGSFLTYRELNTKRRPRRQIGSGQPSFSYKPNGLIKQSFSICTASGQKLHLISYTQAHSQKKMKSPTEDPTLREIEIPKGVYPEVNSLDIGGGHPASIHSMQLSIKNSVEISPSLTSSSSWSSDEECYPQSPLLPTQDVPWEKIPCSEDYRQLNALHHQLRI